MSSSGRPGVVMEQLSPSHPLAPSPSQAPPLPPSQPTQSVAGGNKPPSELEVNKEQWSESSRLLFQRGYFKVLKEMALSGNLQQYNIRSVCWRLFLHCLPEDQDQWCEVTRQARQVYASLKKKHVTDPHLVTNSLDITLNNPLSLDEDSPWNQYFQDNELRQLIDQDVTRTFPETQFFRQDHIQSAMLDILFCYAKEHPEISYRQGMHELLAPMLFVLYAEMRDVNDPSLAPVLKVVMDPMYIEHDAYTIFSELMDIVQPWYMCSSLEADKNQRRLGAMALDPRTNRPFVNSDDFVPPSAITRKLDVIHDVHLKRADKNLHVHLKNLAIPSQTYGIRWIRLLFGREFALPSVLELWDALFADGPSLSLVDYMCVAMLMHIREVLIEGNYAMCMQHLMKFPAVYEVNYLVQRALHLRNPSVYPSPRIWMYHPNREPHRIVREPHPTPPSSSSVFSPPYSSSRQPGNIQTSSSVQSRANKMSVLARHTFSSAKEKTVKALRPNKQLTPPPSSHLAVSNSPSISPSHSPSPRTPSPQQRGGNPHEQEMMDNPKTRPRSGSTNLEKVMNQLDTLEAKCRYCGSKMETLLSQLEDEVTELEMSEESGDVILPAIAGLKQLRDFLLNKIAFGGENVDAWEEAATPSPKSGRKEESGVVGHPLESSGEIPQREQLPHSAANPTMKTSTDTQQTLPLAQSDESPPDSPVIDNKDEAHPIVPEMTFHPLLDNGEVVDSLSDERDEGEEEVKEGEVEVGKEEEGEEWVHLSSSPLFQEQ